MTPRETIECHSCGSRIAPMVLVERAESYWARLGLFVSSLPCCGTREEFQLRGDDLVRGYVYAAGQPHFCAVETYRVEGVRVEHGDPTRLVWDGGERLVAPLS